MIIDTHAHAVFPQAISSYAADLVASRANPTAGPRQPITDEALHEIMARHIGNMDKVGTDWQIISPRPFMQLHSVDPAKVTQTWVKFNNDTIARQVAMFPDRIKGMAGLPQHRDYDLKPAIDELERAVTELGFVGCLLNPDPGEGGQLPPPGLGEDYWYPLYEKMVELDVPALVHSASSQHSRESYTLKFINEESIAAVSLTESTVFDDFPTLKLIIPHGGGALPYQMGRFHSWSIRRKQESTFLERLGKIWFDTTLYSEDALRLLFNVMGTDRLVFGTERPGTGSAPNPKTGRDFDDTKPTIETLLDAAGQKAVFEDNARTLFGDIF
ncbi:amidohydrolase family protein [Actibacterium sp.]|uniref:amidohydrolase family protein n=1 Tax=Actibacterium sp. TaxID=1872125 RepID=UPI003562B2C2